MQTGLKEAAKGNVDQKGKIIDRQNKRGETSAAIKFVHSVCSNRNFRPLSAMSKWTAAVAAATASILINFKVDHHYHHQPGSSIP